MVNINNMPMSVRLLLIQLMITHESHIPGELRVVDGLLEMLNEYQKTTDYQMPQDAQEAMNRLRIMREEYRKSVDDLLTLAEVYGFVDRKELGDALRIYKLLS